MVSMLHHKIHILHVHPTCFVFIMPRNTIINSLSFSMHIVIHLSQSIQIPPTIEDPTAYDEIHGALKEHNLL